VETYVREAMNIGWAEKGIARSRKDEKNDNLVRECVNYRDILHWFQEKFVSL
jgi:hypothetical protein